MEAKKAARHSGNHTAPFRLGLTNPGKAIVPDCGRGGLLMGMMAAIAFGLCMIHWAVVA